MRMTVYLADLDAEPRPAAELSAISWTAGHGLTLAPAVRNHVLPRLAAAGLLPQ